MNKMERYIYGTRYCFKFHTRYVEQKSISEYTMLMRTVYAPLMHIYIQMYIYIIYAHITGHANIMSSKNRTFKMYIY